jgi:hypothetical protein
LIVLPEPAAVRTIKEISTIGNYLPFKPYTFNPNPQPL